MARPAKRIYAMLWMALLIMLLINTSVLGTHTGTAGACNHTVIMPGEEQDPGSVSDSAARTHLNENLIISDDDDFPENNLHDTATQFQYTLQNDTPPFDSVSPAVATKAQF